MIRRILGGIHNCLRIYKFNHKRNCNISYRVKVNHQTNFEGHNVVNSGTVIVNSEVGIATYISSNCSLSHTKIGRYCSIATNVKVIIGTHPTSCFVSTHPLFYADRNFVDLRFRETSCFNEYKYIENGRYMCGIGNDVWIGQDARIMSGIVISDGAIVAAGAVVCNDVPPYAIVGGVPAKVIRYRFSENIVKQLVDFRWWTRDISWLKANCEVFRSIDIFGEKYLRS